MSNSNKLVTLKTLEDFNENKTKNIFVTKDGDTTIKGNFIVTGETVTVDQKNLTIDNNQIIANYDGGTLVGESGFIVKTGSSVELSEGDDKVPLPEAYGITYNPDVAVNGVRLGLGVVKDGNFEFSEGEAQFIATREAGIADGALVSWDAEANTLVGTNLSEKSITTAISDVKIETLNEVNTKLEAYVEKTTYNTKVEEFSGAISDLTGNLTEISKNIQQTQEVINNLAPVATTGKLADLIDDPNIMVIFDSGCVDSLFDVVVLESIGTTLLC